MTTFANWLTDQEHRQDATGSVARWWKSFEGNRPKRSAPSPIALWLQQNDADNWNQWGKDAWAIMLEEYRSQPAGHLQIVRETPAQAIVTLGAIHQALTEVNLRLSTIEANLQVIGAHAGVDWIEPDRSVMTEAAGPVPGIVIPPDVTESQRQAYEQVKAEATAGQNWPTLYDMAEWGDDPEAGSG